MRIATPDDADVLAQLINGAFAVEMFFKRGDRTSSDDVRSLMGDGEFFVHDREDGSPGACVFVKRANGRGYFGMLSVVPASLKKKHARQIIVEIEDQLHRE